MDERPPEMAAKASVECADMNSLYRRVALRLIPFLFLCYVVAMIDRLNVGFAKLQFSRDLGFTETVFGTAAGALYVGYVLFEVPSNLLLARVGVRATLLRIMVAWGVVTMLLAFARSERSFYLLRFLLGAAEAGFFPGIILYLSFWFPARLRGRVISLFAAGVPVAGIVAGPLSGAILTHLDGFNGLRGWQWLFLLEGAPAILLGVAAWALLIDRPAAARFLTRRERNMLTADLAGDLTGDLAGKSATVLAMDGNTVAAPAVSSFADVLRTPRLHLLAFVYFTFFSLQSVLLLWVPTILKSVGVASPMAIGWRSGLISLVGAVGMLGIGWWSDRLRDRRLLITGVGLLAVCCFLLLPLGEEQPLVTTALLAAAAAFSFAFLALFWTVPSSFLRDRAAAGGIAMISSVGACGSAVSPIFIGWLRDHTGSLFGAIDVLALLFAVGSLVLFASVPRPTQQLVLRAS